MGTGSEACGRPRGMGDHTLFRYFADKYAAVLVYADYGRRQNIAEGVGDKK